jgi:molecular chaperone GrpE (heat shock protein)
MGNPKRAPNRYELRGLLRRLDTINLRCGGPGANPEADESLYKIPEEALVNMSPFQQDEVKLAMAMKQFRDTLVAEEQLAKGKSVDQQLQHPKLARMRQDLRKQETALRPLQRSMTANASNAQEKDRTREALQHLSNLRKRYERQRDSLQLRAFGTSGDAATDDRDDRLYPSDDRGNIGAPLLNNIDDLGQGNAVNLREDAEFALFFENIAHQDKRIDEALDRITAGTQVLKENAMKINQELKTQNELLDEVQGKVERVTTKLETLDRRVKKAINDLEKDRMCIYMICCVILLGLIGGILYETGVIKT